MLGGGQEDCLGDKEELGVHQALSGRFPTDPPLSVESCTKHTTFECCCLVCV